MAKPLNPTARTRNEMAMPLVWEKPTTRRNVASSPNPEHTQNMWRSVSQSAAPVRSVTWHSWLIYSRWQDENRRYLHSSWVSWRWWWSWCCESSGSRPAVLRSAPRWSSPDEEEPRPFPPEDRHVFHSLLKYLGPLVIIQKEYRAQD